MTKAKNINDGNNLLGGKFLYHLGLVSEWGKYNHNRPRKKGKRGFEALGLAFFTEIIQKKNLVLLQEYMKIYDEIIKE